MSSLTPIKNVPVLVLNWNGWDESFACLRQLRAQTEAANLWLIDNGSREDRSGEVETHAPGTRVLRLAENFGWAGGYNRALAIAGREGVEFAYLLNNDAHPQPGFLSSVLDAAQKTPGLAAVGSMILYEEPVDAVRFDGHYHHRNALYLHQLPERSAPLKLVQYVNGAGMLIRLKDWERHPFDERFFCYHEETAWCWTARKQARTLAMHFDSKVAHGVRGSDRNANAAYYLTRNQFLLDEFRSPLRARRRRCAAHLRRVYHILRAKLQPDNAYFRAFIEGDRDGRARKFGPRSNH